MFSDMRHIICPIGLFDSSDLRPKMFMVMVQGRSAVHFMASPTRLSMQFNCYTVPLYTQRLYIAVFNLLEVDILDGWILHFSLAPS